MANATTELEELYVAEFSLESVAAYFFESPAEN